MKQLELNGKKVIDYDIECESFRDFDDYDAWFCAAYFEDGTELTHHELEQLNDKYSDLIFDAAYDSAVMSADFME